MPCGEKNAAKIVNASPGYEVGTNFGTEQTFIDVYFNGLFLIFFCIFNKGIVIMKLNKVLSSITFWKLR